MGPRAGLYWVHVDEGAAEAAARHAAAIGSEGDVVVRARGRGGGLRVLVPAGPTEELDRGGGDLRALPALAVAFVLVDFEQAVDVDLAAFQQSPLLVGDADG